MVVDPESQLSKTFFRIENRLNMSRDKAMNARHGIR